MQRTPTPLTLGWEAARANAVPALIIQAIMLALLIGYYTSNSISSAFLQLAVFKHRHGLLFVVAASITAGALIPELFLILFFQRGRPKLRNLRNLFFTIPVWGFDGTLVDLLYRGEAAWLGDVVTLPVVAAKICVDQFAYNPFFAAPFGVLTYEWKNSGVSMRPVHDLFHVATLPGQNCADFAGDMGGLDSADGNHLFTAPRAPISAVRTRAFLLGAAFDLYDQSLCRKN